MPKKFNLWDKLDPDLVRPDKFRAIIEIPKGSKQKYEVDEETGMLRLDRILYTSTHYPANYGFIPLTLSEDGDALDVLVLSNETLQPMCMVDCYPIGAISMIDDSLQDDKIIAIPFGDPQMNAHRDMSDLPKHIAEEIQHFFSVYKELEGKETSLTANFNAVEAKEIIVKCLKRYKENS